MTEIGMRSRLRLLARFILTMLLLASLAYSAFNAWILWQEPLVRLWADRGEDEIAARVDAALHRYATPEAIAEHLRGLLVAVPRDWARIEALTDLTREMEIALPPDVLSGIESAGADDHSMTATTQKCMLCAWSITNCDLSAALFCRIPVDLTPIGDVMVVAVQTGRVATGAEVDEIDLALSAVGLAAVAIVPLTGGTSLSLKVGAGLMKMSYRMGALSVGLLAEARKVAARAIDWASLRRLGWREIFEDTRRYIQPAALAPLGRTVRHASEIRDAVGIRRGMFLLRRADSEVEMRRIALVARASPRKATGAMEILGKRRLLRLAMRWSDEVWHVLHGIAGMVSAIVLLVLSTVKSIALRGLRLAAR